MDNIDARGRIEELTVRLLRQRGWTIKEAKRETLDLDLFVEFDGVPGRVLFRNGFHVAKGVSQVTEPSPCFIRVDLGEPSGDPKQWALWDHYSFPSGRDTPRFISLVVHESMGETWVSVAGNSVGPQGTWYEDNKAIETVLARAEVLCPKHDEASRRGQMFDVQRKNHGVQRKRGGAIIGAIVSLAIGVGLVGLLVLLGRNSVNSQGFMTVAGIFGFIAFVFFSVGLGVLLSQLVTSKKPIEGMKEILEVFRSTGTFETFAFLPMKRREGLPVVVRSSGILDESRAPLWLSRVEASSASHPIRLEADLCHVQWPDGVLPEARFIPDRWLTVDFMGPQAELAKLPMGQRGERSRDVVRWIFTGREIEAGEVKDLFQRMAAAIGASGGPYR
jgi:hypothetical protein